MTDEQLIETMPGANTAPPLLLLQGTGGTNREMLNFGRRLAPQSPLITIGGRQGQGQQRQYYSQTAAGPVNPQQIATEADWLGQQAQAICQENHWDSNRLVVVGYSNGAAMAAYGVQTGQLPGQAALLFHPLLLPVAQPAARPGYHAWLSAGAHDPLVTVATVKKVLANLAAIGVATTLEETGGTHQLTPQEVLAAQQWLMVNAL
ncbi:alpha/beta hydrolase [Levilactobacillus yiduensis]|uniref:alpha/beta hydrolase n=1 Tax=Levilactobacillus yiduensis TaxID=2953880 RepID=UPI000EF348C2|nr:alpha/beta hydrolase fold domain-containing protein [Levilactobacillus yiduensis]AYM02486.1 esterase [Levilactobacillus brevis]